MISILKQVRQEGFVVGWQSCRDAYRERDDNSFDAGFDKGYAAASKRVPSRIRWFTIGAVVAWIGTIFPAPLL